MSRAGGSRAYTLCDAKNVPTSWAPNFAPNEIFNVRLVTRNHPDFFSKIIPFSGIIVSSLQFLSTTLDIALAIVWSQNITIVTA